MCEGIEFVLFCIFDVSLSLLIAGNVRSTGHACAVEQDISGVIAKLVPLHVATCGVMLLRLIGSTSGHKDLIVRRDYVRRLILFYRKAGTPRYPKGTDEQYLEGLPVNGMPADLKVSTSL